MSESDDRVATWDDEDRYWSQNFRSRPYATADRGYEHYQPAYRYGWESARMHRGRRWEEVEPELRTGWERYEHRGSSRSTWEEIKDSVRDAWNRATS